MVGGEIHFAYLKKEEGRGKKEEAVRPRVGERRKGMRTKRGKKGKSAAILPTNTRAREYGSKMLPLPCLLTSSPAC
ncbi:MAG: hypothetical protein F6K39_20325 [Okeania sp. SIO3B3]|nr:hypothetical protein [Okeania sp. SIO3B3]